MKQYKTVTFEVIVFVADDIIITGDIPTDPTNG